MCLGKRVLVCHHGRDRHKSDKSKYKQQKEKSMVGGRMKLEIPLMWC